jgi:spermidine synthase
VKRQEALSVIPWSLLDKAQVPGGGGELRLMRRGTEFSIRLGHNELMNSRLSGSEEALATIACERIKARNRPQILIGGLGMGFTLRAALTVLGSEARITVAELVPAVLRWARGSMVEVSGTSLTDPRVSIREADVGHLIRAGRSTFDAILLDVDNGPVAMAQRTNSGLYDDAGLARIKAALKPDGMLAVWSAWDDRKFEHRLRYAGFTVETERVRGRLKKGGPRHTIFLGSL